MSKGSKMDIRFSAVLFLAPAMLLGQPAQVGPLESRSDSREVASRRKPASFGRRMPAVQAWRMGKLRQEEMDAVARDPQLPLRGFERQLGPHAPRRGQWQTLEDGRRVWRVAVQADGATGMRLLFSQFHAGSGEVWVYSPDGSQVFGPYSGDGIDGSGSFWSNTVFGDSMVAEYQPPDPLPADGSNPPVPFVVTRIAHLVVEGQPLAAGSCELDVSCYSTWSAAASGVGMYIFQSGGGTYACSGALVNNTSKDLTPYFLTANHCVSDATSAASVEVFWNDQTTACNGAGPNLGTVPRTLGATYLVSAPMGSGDYSLMRLSPLPNIPLNFFGWNSSATAVPLGTNVTGIHHPAADYTRITFGARAADVPAQVGSDLAPANMFYQVLASSGRVEPGSSGSPLFTADKMIVGTLSFGPTTPACSTSPFVAGYGRFSVAYPAMSKWLSPAGGPSSTGSGTTPAAPPTVTLSQSSFPIAWTIGAAAPAASQVQVSTTSATPLVLTLRAGQSWIGLSTTSITVSAGKPGAFTFRVATSSFASAGSSSGSITLSGTGITQAVSVTVTVAAPAAAVEGGPVSLIPLFRDGGGAATTFTLINPYSTATDASISFASPAGAALQLQLSGATAANSWQNVTIPAFGSITLVTPGTSSPQKQGMAMVQSSDPTKRVLAYAQINQDVVAPAVSRTMPMAVPFDATTAATTTLYLYNPATSGSIVLGLMLYDPSGAVIGSGQVTIPAGQEGVVAMSKTAAVFGGRKGTLYLSGSGTVLAAALRVAADGGISTVMPW